MGLILSPIRTVLSPKKTVFVREETKIKTVAFTDENTTVIVIVNPEENGEALKLDGLLGNSEIYLTDETHNCEKIYDGKFESTIEIPAKSIVTVKVEM